MRALAAVIPIKSLSKLLLAAHFRLNLKRLPRGMSLIPTDGCSLRLPENCASVFRGVNHVLATSCMRLGLVYHEFIPTARLHRTKPRS